MSITLGLRIGLAASLLLLAGCGTLQISVESQTPDHPAALNASQPAASQTNPAAVTRPAPSAPILTPTTPVPATLAESGRITGTAEVTAPVTYTQAPASRLAPGTPVHIVHLHMLDARLGWGVGQSDQDLNDHILYTEDGGLTWKDRSPLGALSGAPATGLVVEAAFNSSRTAWAVYSDRRPPAGEPLPAAWQTQDGGQTWSAGQPFNLAGIQMEFFTPSHLGFLDRQNGWVMVHLGVGMNHDYIAVFTTQDGGRTWQRQLDPDKNPELMGCQKTALVFSTPAIGWLAGNCPGLMDALFFYRTVDGGRTWQPARLPAAVSMPATSATHMAESCGITQFISTSARMLLLNLRCINYSSNRAQSWLYRSPDGGATWEASAVLVPYGVFHFINPSEGWLLGSNFSGPSSSNEIFHTLDGGQTWTSVLPVGWQGEIDYVDTMNGWVVAANGSLKALVHTTDGGKTWREQKAVIAP